MVICDLRTQGPSLVPSRTVISQLTQCVCPKSDSVKRAFKWQNFYLGEGGFQLQAFPPKFRILLRGPTSHSSLEDLDFMPGST